MGLRLAVDFTDRERATEQVTLREVYPQRFQPLELFGGFHTFGRNRHVETRASVTIDDMIAELV